MNEAITVYGVDRAEMDIVQEELDRLSVKKRSPLKEEATSGKL